MWTIVYVMAITAFVFLFLFLVGRAPPAKPRIYNDKDERWNNWNVNKSSIRDYDDPERWVE